MAISAATMPAISSGASGTAGSSGATTGSSSAVSASVKPSRTVAGSSASPTPGSIMQAAPMRLNTSTRPNPQAGS